MTKQILHVPLHMPRHQGFFSDASATSVLGRKASLNSDRPYSYLIIEDVSVEEAEDLLHAVRRCLAWAAVRLDQGILTSREPLKRVQAGLFDGQFPTAYPDGAQAEPIRVGSNHRSEEPASRFFAALDEGARQTDVMAQSTDSKRLIACEIFSAVDFELSANAQFLALSMVLEVLAAPKERPPECVNLVNELLSKSASLRETADPALKLALTSLEDSVEWMKKESITSSIRKLAMKAAIALGDSDPSQEGKKGAGLYSKRSQLIHHGKSVTQADVKAIRKLARECLAVEMNCYHAVRERFP